MPRIDEEGRAAWGSRASGLLAVLLGGDVAAAAGHAGGGVLLLSGGNRGAAGVVGPAGAACASVSCRCAAQNHPTPPPGQR